MRVSVVIPAFNAWRLTQACVRAVRAATAADLLAEIVVADDGSTDGESAAWAAAEPGVTAVLAERNGGFSRACNAGAAASAGELLFFLNNDAFVRPGAIAALRTTLCEDPAIGIVGARLLYADGSLQHAGLALLDGPVSRWWHVHRQLSGTLPDAGVARDVLAVTGAALMISRSRFDALGGFDPGFINGWEDVDLCLKAWSHGARVRYEPAAVIDHLESATLGRRHDDRANEARFVERWTAALAPAPRYPLAEIPPLALAFGRSGDPGEAWAREHLRTVWGPAFGAKVRLTRAGSRVDRARVELDAALAKRRPTLEVSVGAAARRAPTGPLRVAFVAPRSDAEARLDATARGVARWWTASGASRDLLAAAGIDAGQIDVVPLGGALPERAPVRAERAREPVVAALEADAGLLDALRGHSPEVRTVVLGSGKPILAGIDVVVAATGGDRWGLLIPAALAHGCRVVTTAPLDDQVAATLGVAVAEPAQILDVLRGQIAESARLRADASEIALAARRRLDARLAAQRGAALARALVHGSPSAATIAVSPALAARLRAARAVPA